MTTPEKSTKPPSAEPSITESEETLTVPGRQFVGHPGDEQRVEELARGFSSELTREGPGELHNPFLAVDSTLDPCSPNFDAKHWAQTLFATFDRDPDRYPRAKAGVVYRNLSVHGFGSPTDYQNDVFNVLLRGPQILYEQLHDRRRKVEILKGFDGLVKSGEMLLVLGRPGSGVTTLLKTIACEMNGLRMDPESHISYQGVPMETIERRFRGEVIYQAETDVHFPQLTVGQTLLFASLARTPKNRLPGVSRQHYAQHIRDVVMAFFGISHTVNTKVGNDFVRGVSGGERKRVSIAEVALSGSAIQCWDNSTRGLDSATALEFARALRLSADLARTAPIVAMYQASQAAYDTFDKVAVLYEGRQIYFGPVDAAKDYFVAMGYHCPDRQTTADFLTSLTNPSERIVQPGLENKVPRTSEDFAKCWERSETRALLMEEIAAFEQAYPMDSSQVDEFAKARKAQQTSLARHKSPFTLSVPMQIRLCMTRSYQRIMGDKTFFIVTVAGNFVISLVLGSVYYDLPSDASSINTRCIVLFFTILFNALSSALEILSLYAQRPIVEKHFRYALYHPASEAIASAVCELPSKILSAVAFNIPLYFMAGLRDGADHFFIFLLFGFTCTLTMSMILRTIGQASRSIHQALTPAAVFIIALVIYTGFVLPTRDMQGWLRWINYINPIAYAYESLVVNELGGRNFPCIQFVPAYPDAAATERTCSTPGALPGADFVSGDIIMNATFEYYKSHMWRNLGILFAFMIFFFATYTISAELVTASRSKGEILVFRRGHKAADRPKATGPHLDDSSNGKSVQRNEGNDSKKGDIFHWKDVCYDITIKDENRRILDHVDGWVKPGTLTVLMGVSGAGKTTLLDVLANRVTMGIVSGDMLVNGSLRDQSFQRKTGYVQQQDVHLETSTVREALRFSALLRQPATTSKEDKYAFVEEVIDLLEMEEYADAIVGVPGEGLNVEQRKRLTIGVELAAKPDLLLFLDEPTSGLDSQTAWSVATLVRKLSNAGQAVLCTIHQPSAMLFQQFDRLLLLNPGGKTVYFGDIGENSTVLTNYFEKYGATPCGSENPAEWMLRVTGVAPGAKAERDWVQTWKSSEEYSAVQHELEELKKYETEGHRGDLGHGGGHRMSKYAAPSYYQLYMCTKRVFEQYWRTPSYIYSKLILCFGTSLFISLSFYKAKLTQQGLQNQMFSIFMLLVIFAFLTYQTMPHFIRQRELYEIRERASRTYSWHAFMLANIIVELPWNTVAALVTFLPFYYIVGMDRNAIPTDTVAERGGLMFLLLWVFLIFESTFADMVVAGVPTAELGATLGLLLFVFCLIFCGVMVPKSALPRFWIFMYRVSPLTYLISSLLSTGLAGHAIQCSAAELLRFRPPTGLTCGQYMEPYMQLAGGAVSNPGATDLCEFCALATTDAFLASVDVFYVDRWRNFGLMWVYVLFNLAAALFLYWLARVPKKAGLKAKGN